MTIEPTRAHRPGRRPPRWARLARSAFGLALVATAMVALIAPPATRAWTAGTFSASSESQLLALTNQARANAGLKALVSDSTLAAEARARSKDMIDKGYFSHSIPPDGHTVFTELRAMGFCYSSAGENIGLNTYPDATATQEIQNSFMASPAHLSNILGVAWDVIGIGAYQGATDKRMWTVLFAGRCGSTPPPTPPRTPAPTPAPTRAPTSGGGATPRPTRTAAPQPTADPTDAPPPEPTPEITAEPTLPPDLEPPDLNFDPSLPLITPIRPSSAPTATPRPTAPTIAEPGLRVIDPPVPQDLFETIVGGVTGFFFGS